MRGALAVSGCDQDRAGARLLAVGTSIAGFTSSSGAESSSVSEHGPAARRGPPLGAGPANSVSVAVSAANTTGGSRSPFLPERDSRDLIMVTSPDLITEALYAGWWTDISGAAVDEARTSNRDRDLSGGRRAARSEGPPVVETSVAGSNGASVSDRHFRMVVSMLGAIPWPRRSRPGPGSLASASPCDL
jgi:hypothetical protein